MWSEWLKLDNVKWLFQTAAIPVTLAILSQQYQCAQTERQAHEARLRLYTELLSKREEADTGVRRGIFDKVFEKYLEPQDRNLDARLVALELLAVNFNESLDLSPLFWKLDREIQQVQRRSDLRAQLERITTAVKAQQISTLEAVGATALETVDFTEPATSGPLIDRELSYVDPDPLSPKGRTVRKRIKVDILDHQPDKQRILIRVGWAEGQSVFWVDKFDFPLANFVRMSKSERFSVVLNHYRREDAQLTLIYFPASRSGAKDKPFLDEVISDLKRKES